MAHDVSATNGSKYRHESKFYYGLWLLWILAPLMGHRRNRFLAAVSELPAVARLHFKRNDS